MIRVQSVYNLLAGYSPSNGMYKCVAVQSLYKSCKRILQGPYKEFTVYKDCTRFVLVIDCL
jgi:hypothetical protein